MKKGQTYKVSKPAFGKVKIVEVNTERLTCNFLDYSVNNDHIETVTKEFFKKWKKRKLN